MNYRYNKGDTVYIRCKHETYDFATDAWSLADPDSGYPKITEKDSAGTVKVDATSMAKIDVGKFEHKYQLASDALHGVWPCFIEISSGGYKDKEYFSFEVI